MKYQKSFFKLSVLFTSAVIIAIFYACNPAYDNVSGMLPTGLHPVKPVSSAVYHGAEYRFPDSNCNESQCHGPNLTGGNTGGPSCYSCHNNLWDVFLVSHTEPIGGFYHHYAVDGSNVASCLLNGCHGNNGSLYSTNLPGYDFRYACHACHPNIP